MADTKDLLSCTRIENAHKARKTICVFYYVAVICTTTEGTKQIRACVSRYGQSAWTASQWRRSKWCTYCKHRCAAVLAHTQDCHIKKRNGKPMIHQKVTQIKQVKIREFWNSAQKINLTSVIIFQSIFVIFPLSHDVEKVTSLSVWVCAAHLEYRSLALKNVKISGTVFVYVKTSVDKKTSFEKFRPCSMCQ